MKKLIITIGILLLAVSVKAAETDILTAFFGPNGIKEKSAVYHGEMLKLYVDKPTLGEGLPRDVQVTFKKLSGTNDSAVYAVLLSKEEKSQDWYVYLVKENDVWKLSAVRSLALSGLFFMALEEIEKKNPRSEEEEWIYQNMLLTIKSDADLKAYLKDNIVKFKEVMALFKKGDKPLSEKKAKSLFLNSVSDEDGITVLNIGGMIDNAVGYLYVPDGKNPPEITPNHYIYIEKVLDGWYVYKTT